MSKSFIPQTVALLVLGWALGMASYLSLVGSPRSPSIPEVPTTRVEVPVSCEHAQQIQELQLQVMALQGQLAAKGSELPLDDVPAKRPGLDITDFKKSDLARIREALPTTEVTVENLMIDQLGIEESIAIVDNLIGPDNRRALQVELKKKLAHYGGDHLRFAMMEPEYQVLYSHMCEEKK